MSSEAWLLAGALLVTVAALAFALLRWRSARRRRYRQHLARLAVHTPHRFPKRRG